MGRTVLIIIIIGCGLALAWYAWPYANRYFHITLPPPTPKIASVAEPAPKGNALKEVGKMIRQGQESKSAREAGLTDPETPTSGQSAPLKAPPVLLPSASGGETTAEQSPSESGAANGEGGSPVEEMQPHTFERTLHIPADGHGTRKVRLTYEDGSTVKPEELLNELHSEGDSIPIKIDYRGRRLTLHLYYDGWFVKTWSFALPTPPVEPAEPETLPTENKDN
jgi:hypothetical protein